MSLWHLYLVCFLKNRVHPPLPESVTKILSRWEMRGSKCQETFLWEIQERKMKKKSFVASQKGRFCQADTNADCGSVPVYTSVSRGVPRSHHGGPDEKGRQQPWPHHLRRVWQGWQAQSVKPTARWASSQVRSPLCGFKCPHMLLCCRTAGAAWGQLYAISQHYVSSPQPFRRCAYMERKKCTF